MQKAGTGIGAGIILCLIAAGCHPDPTVPIGDIVVDVQVEGVVEARTLKAWGTVKATPLLSDYLVSEGPRRFEVRVPRSQADTIDLLVKGYSLDRCLVAQGQLPVTLSQTSPEFISVRLPLTVADRKVCTLRVEQKGEGSVVSDPPGLLCERPGVCSADFPHGTRVTLSRNVPTQSIDFAWYGACLGKSERCEVTMDQASDLTARFVPRVCLKDALTGASERGWCWYNALPSGWHAGPNTAWGFGSNDVYVGSSYGLAHFDGLVWDMVAKTPSSAFGWANDLHGLSPKDMWSVGYYGNIMHYDGTDWKYAGAVGSCVWEAAANDVWVGGGEGLQHYDGKTWTQASLPLKAAISDIWGSSANDLWAVGSTGVIFHYQDRKWTQVPVPSVKTDLVHVWGKSKTQAWIAGKQGTLLRWDGSRWQPVSLGTAADVISGAGVADEENPDNNNVWVSLAGNGVLRMQRDGSFARVPYPQEAVSDGGGEVRSMWAADPDHVWMGGVGAQLLQGRRGGGGKGEIIEHHRGIQGHLRRPGGVWGSSQTDVWFTGWIGYLYHFNGRVFDEVRLPGVVRAIAGNGQNSAFAAGDRGVVFFFDGTKWTSIPTGTTQNLYRVWVSPLGVAWIVGNGGTVLRCTQSECKATNSPTTANLGIVWGTRESEVWISSGTELFRGTIQSGSVSWKNLTADAGGGGPAWSSCSVWGSSSSDVWIIIDGSKARHFDGTKWVDALLPGKEYADLWGDAPNNYWAIGSWGTLARYDGYEWKQGFTFSSNLQGGIWGQGHNVWVTGDNGMILRFEP